MSAHPLLFSRHHSHPLHLLRRAPFPDCLFPFFLKINPSQARDASLPTRSPSTSLSGCARIRGREQQHDCWSCCSLLRHLTSVPRIPLPPSPAGPRRHGTELAHGSPPCSSGPHSRKGTSGRTAPAGDLGRQGRGAEGRRRRRKGCGLGGSRGLGWDGVAPAAPASEAAARQPARPPAPPACPPRRRKRRRLGSAQFKLSPRPPPLPSPRPPRPGSSASPPRRSTL